MVLRQGLLPVAVGLVGGLIAAAGLGRVVRGLLYEVSPWDPITFAGVATIVLAAATVALWLPARQATRIDPVRSLKAE